MINYDLFSDDVYSKQLNVVCVTVPIYLLYAFKLGALDDKDKFEKYVLTPFHLKDVAFSGEDLSDELANVLTIEGNYLAIIDHYSDLEQDIKDIFEKDLQLEYGLAIVDGEELSGNDSELGHIPYIPSYTKAIDALKEVYSVNVHRDDYRADWQDFFTNYASYAIELITTGHLDTGSNACARRTMGTKMIQSVIKALIDTHHTSNSTWAIRTFSDMYTLNDLYTYLADHEFLYSIDPKLIREIANINCEKAGRLLMAFFSMAAFPTCNYDTVCVNFLKAKLKISDYAIYNEKQNEYQDVLSSGLVTLDTITSYYLPIICSNIVLQGYGAKINVPSLKSYMISPYAYLVNTSTLREFGFTSATSKAIYIRSTENSSSDVPFPCNYPGLYTLCKYVTDNFGIIDATDDELLSPMDIAWSFAECLSVHWATIPLPFKYILVSNYMVELLATKPAGNLINTDPRLHKKHTDISTAAELISKIIDDVPANKYTKEFEASLKETLISKYGALNAATYVNLVSSGFVDFLNELVMTRIMY